MESIWSDYDFRKTPFDRIDRVGQRSLLYRDLFCVSWLLGRFCNYKCSYCWPYARSDKKDHRDTGLVLRTLDEIKRQARERGLNSFHFSFSGGEPTLHPGYLEILSHYSKDGSHSNYQSVHMTSNLSPGLKWFEKYVRATENLHRVSITGSFHREFAKKDRFAEKILFLQENDVHVTINSVMVPQFFHETWDDLLYFHDQGINVTLKPQSNSSATKVVEGYDEEMLAKLQNGMPQRNYTQARMSFKNRVSMRPKASLGSKGPQNESAEPTAPPHFQVELTDNQGESWFFDQAERFNAFNFNQFDGWECSAGYRSIIIREPDGLIKRSYSCSDEPLGHIETGFQLFDKPAPCITKSCVSSADSKIPKRKAGVSLPLWPGDESYL
ncbi:MAG: radical SAM protein [Pseudomonadota bacterium]